MSNAGVATCGSQHLNTAGNVVSDYNAHHASFQYFPTTANPHHVSVTNPDMIGQNDPSGTPAGSAVNHQYDESDFYTALQANNLPAVTFLKGANYQDGHAGTTESDPLGEQKFVSDVVDSVEQSPSWASTAIVLMYDDSDGWYDHVFHAPVNTSADPQYDFLNGGGAAGGACGTPGGNSFAPLGGTPGPLRPRPAAAAARDLAVGEDELHRQHVHGPDLGDQVHRRELGRRRPRRQRVRVALGPEVGRHAGGPLDASVG